MESLYSKGSRRVEFQQPSRLGVGWKVFSTCVYCFANCCFCYTFIDIFLNRRVEKRTSFGSLMIFGIIFINVVKSTPINQNSDTNLRKLSIIKLPIKNRKIDINVRTTTLICELRHIICECTIIIGMTGFEPAAPSSRTKCATKLRHIPP